MYNIDAQHGKVMTEDAKIRFLFKKIQHSGLEGAIEAMKAKTTTEPVGTVTYSTVVNNILTTVFELPDQFDRNRRVSGITNDSHSKEIYNSNGTVNTRDHKIWLQLSVDDCKKSNDK